MEIQGYWRWIQQQGVYIWETLGYIDIIALYEMDTLSFPALGLTLSCEAFIDPYNLCGSSCLLIPA
jgi:hypothetical protein